MCLAGDYGMDAVFGNLQEAQCQLCSAGKCTHPGHRGADGQADLSERAPKAIAVFFQTKGHYGMSPIDRTQTKSSCLSKKCSISVRNVMQSKPLQDKADI